MTSRGWLLLVLILGFVMTIVSPTLSAVAFRARADEGYYLAYAARLSEQGFGAFPALFRDYMQDPIASSGYPSPHRLLTLSIDALAVRWWGPNFFSLQRVSVIAFLFLLAFLFVGLVHTVSGSVACWTALLLAASPLHLGMARRALADSLTAAAMVGSLWIFIETLLTPRPSWRQWVGVAGAFFLTFLTKESTLVLTPIALCLLLWQWFVERRPPTVRAIGACSIVPVGLALLAMSWGVGSIGAIGQWLEKVDAATRNNQYALAFTQGPWFRFLIDYLLLSPWTTLLYLLWIGYLIGSRVTDARMWAWALVPLLFLAWLAPFWKNVRNVLVLEFPMRLGAVLFLRSILNRWWGESWRATVGLGAIIGILMWLDLAAFRAFFLEAGIYDPVSAPLLAARRLIPP